VSEAWNRLAKTRLCTGLTRAELPLVHQAARNWHCKAGEILCREGEPARGLYIVLDGLLSRGKIDGLTAETEWLGLSEQFGDQSLLREGNESATVAGLLDSKGLLLGRDQFHRLLERIPRLAVNLCRAWPNAALPEELCPVRRPRLGLALGGGGARGVAHLGVLKALSQMGFTIERIAGTSVGAIVAAFCGSGFAPEETLEIFAKELAPPRLLHALPGGRFLHIAGLFRLGGWRRKLQRYLGDRRLEDLSVPVSMVASDLVTGTVVVREEGNVVDAILESLSQPGPARPVCRDGLSLVDGGVLNNLPADVVRSRGAEFVLAVNVAANLSSRFAGRRPGFWSTLGRVIAVQQQALRALPALAADLVLHPNVSGFAFGDFTQFRAIAKAGEKAVSESTILQSVAVADRSSSCNANQLPKVLNPLPLSRPVIAPAL
jgi:predicted acylesterase/phospholipase RssA